MTKLAVAKIILYKNILYITAIRVNIKLIYSVTVIIIITMTLMIK